MKPPGPDRTPSTSDRADPLEKAAAAERTGDLRERVAFRLFQWTKIFSAYFSAQTVAQLLGIGAGLLFINFMPVQEFALYTLAFSVVSFFHFVTDLGSTSSLVYFRRRAIEQGEDFGAYVAAVLAMRRWLFLLAGTGVLVGFPLFAADRGFSLGDVLASTAAVVLTVWFQLVSSIRLLVLRLEDRYTRSYWAELAGGVVRLSLAGGLVALSLLRAWLGILTAAAASATVSIRAGRQVPTTVDDRDLSPERRRLVRYLLPTLPSSLYFSIQGPLVVWLAAVFGQTENIAEVGALARLGMVVGLFSGLIGTVFMPRLAAVTDERIYLRRYLQFGAFLGLVAGTLLAAALVIPELFLFVLGPSYSGLHRELVLTVAGSGLTLLGGYAVAINLARSWNRWQGAAVGVLVVAQALMVAFLPLGTTAGVLTFNLLTAAVGLVTQVTLNLLGFYRPRWVQWT